MSGHTIVLRDPNARFRARRLIDQAPPGYVMTIAEPRRTEDQSRRMWAMLTDISHAKPGGVRYTPDEWKSRFMEACGWECQFLPGILDGHPFPVGFRSSQLSKKQMSALIDFMQAWGDEQGIRWSEPEQQERAA